MIETRREKIGDFFKVETGSTPSTAVPEYWEGGNIKWITPFDLGRLSSTFISQTSRSITQKGLENSSATLVPAGSIIISTRAPIGYLAVLTEPMAFNQGCKALLPKNGNQFDPLYVFYQLHTKVQEMKNLGSGSTFKEISKEKLESIRILLPPLPIQKQIAAILAKADAAREKRRQANQLTEQFLQSAFLEMFGDPVTNPNSFPVEEMGSICNKITDGEHLTPKLKNSGKYIIMAKDVREDRIDFSQDHFVSEQEFLKFTQRCNPQSGDVVLVSRGATIGRCTMVRVSTPFCLMGSVILIKPREVASHYLVHLFKNSKFEKLVIKLSPASAQQAIYLQNLVKLRVPVPPKKLQRKFAVLVDKVESLRAKQRESEKDLDNLFNSLMQRAFRGELVG